MKKITVFISSLLLLCTSAWSMSLSEAAIAAAKSGSEEKHISSSGGGSSDPCLDACVEACAESAVQILMAGWLANNFGCSYSAYPYSDEETNYVYNKILQLDGEKSSGEGDSKSTGRGKVTRFSADFKIFNFEELGLGHEENVEGLLFPIFGPYLSHTYFYGTADQGGEKNYGNFKIGGQLSVIQSSILSMNGYIQWVHWYGDIISISLKKNGAEFGLDLRSYPVKPLGLSWKIGVTNYEKNLQMITSDLQGGIFVDRLELFAGWKYMSMGNSSSSTITASWNAGYGGIRVYL